MTGERDAITVLSDHESWDLLKSAALGRLVTHIGDQLEIFPVNFVTQGHTVLFRTAEGTKLFSTVMSDKVLFEVDDHTVAEGWSVIIRGTAHVLSSSDEIHEADRAQLLPWVATEKLRYVRITPDELSGRRFVFGPEPERGPYPS
ncbi:pyridoxamine 5'-phosphate oxidase family protein [Mycolicibacterium sphagni]|jgi:nitroimidazol reductase NimA-like FMN-containing flavoprotein (pyridoxamine 5'-phosphate oxidase superfamily)|uniref:Pyridoxamine 5'-phosphate oxidase n=1 Tax=Mycolicibacterium sphagni TaxID=1786 RepID=A0A255DK30_9MYCO|nr:pyridoxamine 5'-phosphate oxidase family protein [Mycolicibacterium sphagni]MCV7176791.1 pyridoxamine 5'-phosphate oxidase family protein [Mycolicibacterium sphagni]OYN77312.1 pyridoxamine 5'-phosphate oxidase [Mycolicibacterium sphagni]